jgi:Flp pilus assembly protein TadD
MKTLPLGMGRTEVVVANWYRERGRLDEAADWFRRAPAVNPANARAYAFLAMLLTREGRHEESLGL